MAKFLQVRSKILSDIETKAFEKRFSPAEMKKLFKCEFVFEFSPRNINECMVVADIPGKDLEKFASAFCCAETDKLGFEDDYSMTSGYIFSDDAEITPISARLLSDDIRISAFELNKKEIVKLTNLLDQFEDKEFKISQLEDADQLWQSLREIEYDFRIDLVSSDGDNEIEGAIEDVRSEIQELASQANSYMSKKWKVKKISK